MAQRLLLSLFLILLTQPLLADSLVVPIGDSPALGAANAPVTIIEFIDFQ
jgi:protein-disulfide isomerase